MFFYVLVVENTHLEGKHSFTIRKKSENLVLGDGFNKCGFARVFRLADHLEPDSGEHLFFFWFWRVILSKPGFL